MKLVARIDGRSMPDTPLHLKRQKHHSVVVQLLDKDGEPTTLVPGQIEFTFSDKASTGRLASDQKSAIFTFRDCRYGTVTVSDGACSLEVDVFGYYTGGFVFLVVLACVLVPVLGVVVLQTIVRVDPALDLARAFFKNLLQTVGVGTSVLIGFPAAKLATERKSIEPFLAAVVSGWGRLGLGLSVLVTLVMGLQRHQVFCNVTNSSIELGRDQSWKAGELFFLLDGQKSLARPLCISGTADCSAKLAEDSPLAEFAWLAGRLVGCGQWWPKLVGEDGKVIAPELSSGCKVAAASTPESDLDILLEFSTGQASARHVSEFKLGPLGLVASGDPSLASARIKVEGEPGGDHASPWLELGPGTSASSKAALKRVRLKASASAERAVTLPVEAGGLLTTELRSGGTAGESLGELTCHVASEMTLLLVAAQSSQLDGFSLYDGGKRISSFRRKAISLHGFVGFCLPSPLTGLRLELVFAETWQPDLRWSMRVPRQVSTVELRLHSGVLLGTISRDSGAPGGDSSPTWSLEARFLDPTSRTGRKRRIPGLIEVTPRKESWSTALEESGRFSQWFWLSREATQCKGSMGRASRAFSCAPGVVRLPDNDCYFANGVRVDNCRGRSRTALADELGFTLRGAIAECDGVYTCTE
jgi:hypothetical protein